MANPQCEDGFTKIANELLEAYMKMRLSANDSQVFWCILRRTYGYRKKEDRIALSQIAKDTDVRLAHVVRSVKRLVARNMVTHSGNRYHVTYAIQKDYESWSMLPKRGTLPRWVTRLPRPGNSHFPALVDTKENKETIQKKNTKMLPEQVIAEWRIERSKVAKIGKRVTKADIESAKSLLHDYELDDLKVAFRNYHFLYATQRYRYLPIARTLHEFVLKELVDKCLDLDEAKRVFIGRDQTEQGTDIDELIKEETEKRRRSG